MTIKRQRRSRGSSNKMVAPQVKSMLSVFGVPINEQPAGATDRNEMLEAMRKTNPDLYDRYYEVIVKGVDPIQVGLDKDSSVITQHEIGNQVRTIFQDYTNEQTDWFKGLAESKFDAIDYEHAKHIKSFVDLTNKKIQEEAAKFRTVQVKVGNNKPVKMKGLVPAVFKTVLQLAQQRKNILLVGPAGSGKTYMARLLSEALEMEYSAQSCTSGMSESQLAGWLLPVGDNGKFTYVSSEFVRIYEEGGIFLLDEIDAADPNVLVFINQALANGEFFLPQRLGKTKVVRHPDAIILAAANTYGNGADMVYVGRNQLDAATLDRFKIGTVAMDYDEEVERALIDEDVLEWGWNIRKKINEKHLQRVMSTRVMIDATDMRRHQDWTLAQIEQRYFSDWSREELAVINGGV